ncbi:unnamed protein product [Kuraishia capsulata CBS 1993]|uniref:GOLD domain-containing protein n=1 Tax=Kuraishia capsulata CBS 1993 TaxID=1382522 RepID=W6MMC7_9ASCO|nr:uncharacterized protein KUCA_T00002023001 [Kuraishia capsulata CBS 1993]CDK26052.1 unnamed protein product [Kuraishia capsulata CBS 1993]
MRLYGVLTAFVLGASLCQAFQLGLTVPPSSVDSAKLMQEVTEYHNELYKLKKTSKKAVELRAMIKSHVEKYISNNLCVRYILNEFTEDHMNQNTLVVVHVKVVDPTNVNELGNRYQQLNFNLIDDEGNTLRRKNDVKESRVAVTIPENPREDAYFDVCYENQMIDKSWKNKGANKDIIMSVEIGISEIVDNLEKSGTALKPVQKQASDIEQEVTKLVNQFVAQIIPDETASRNFNEDLFSKVIIGGIVASASLVIVGVVQVLWLILYLKQNKMI